MFLSLLGLVLLHSKVLFCLFKYPREFDILFASFLQDHFLSTRFAMILEFRIPLPLSVSDFQVAQLSMVIKAQEKVTGGGEGIVVVKNEPYSVYHLDYL